MTTTNNEPLGGENNLMNAVAAALSAYGSSPTNGKDDWLRDRMAELDTARKAALSQQAGAAGAGEVKTWQERCNIPMPEPHEMRFSMREIHRAKDAEIADLRTQLAALDTDKVRLTRELALAEEGAAHWKAKHDAQLARQRKGEPVYQSNYSDKHPHAWVDVEKRQYDLYREHGEGRIPTRVLYTTPAAQAQGEPGSPSARLSFVLAELAKRFPDAHKPFQSDPPELRFLAAIDAVQAQGEPVAKEPKIVNWVGNLITKDSLVQSLEDYSKIMPGAFGRAQWAMREAARYIKAVSAAQADEVRDAVIELQNAYGALERIEEQHLGLAEHRCAANRYHLAASKLVDVARKGTKKGGGQ